jgi:dihydrofolate synthase/folylpolyglutamate synthase
VDELEPHLTLSRRTWFEIVTTLAFMFFARSQIDVAMLEVGLGGRFDATNVVTPIVSVITSLSMDHMNLLGNTLEQIAFEKAGIIKRHVPVVSAPQVPEALDVIRRVARVRGAPLVAVPPPQAANSTRHLQPSPDIQGREWPLPLLGAHQLINTSVAVTALQIVNQQGLPIDDEAIQRGLADVKWPGRLEVLSRDPLVVVDGAHNGDSAQKLAAALREVFHINQWTLIVGISADKDIPAILDGLLPIAEHVIVTRASNSRAAIGALAGERSGEHQQQRGRGAGSRADRQTPIIVTGSLFTVAIREGVV